MIFSGKSVDENNKMETRMIINTCNCGCGSELHITKYVDTDIPNTLTEYYLSLHSSKFDEEQLGIFGVLKRRLKRVWYNLIGKDYLYMDIVMSEKEYKDFVKKLQDLQK